MKVYISADIEGTTGISSWDEAKKGHSDYNYFAKQMTAEVNAAVHGALRAGTEDITVRDAHGSARNIDPSALPEKVKILRGWARDPLMMMQGIDQSYDAAVFTGYHSPSGGPLNPLSHTMSTEIFALKINGAIVSEFALNAMTASYFNVPVVFVSGDAGIIEIASQIIPHVEVVSTNSGSGASVDSIHPAKAVKLIQEGVYRALKADGIKPVTLPESFKVQITYLDHKLAYQMSFFPGVNRRDDRTITFSETDYFEVLRKLLFLL